MTVVIPPRLGGILMTVFGSIILYGSWIRFRELLDFPGYSM